MSEDELLAREAASARRAMDATLREIVGAPPGRDGWRVWAGAHPFILVSGAAVAGALAARFVSPRGGNGHRQGPHPDNGLTAVLKDIGKDFLRTFVETLLVAKAATPDRPRSNRSPPPR